MLNSFYNIDFNGRNNRIKPLVLDFLYKTYDKHRGMLKYALDGDRDREIFLNLFSSDKIGCFISVQ